MNARVGYKAIYDSLKKDIENKQILTGSLLPTELEMANKHRVSRPTVAKVYNMLQDEGYVKKKIGSGTTVVYGSAKKKQTFGLLLPGAGESEIFSIINDQLLNQSRHSKFNCLWEGATANNANIRKDLIESNCDSYIKQKVDGVFFSPLERVQNSDAINDAICKKISDANISMVLIDRDLSNFPMRSKFDMVCLDNYIAGYAMAKHLYESGCELIYFFHRPNSAYSVQQRIAGVALAAVHSTKKFDESSVICGDPGDTALVKDLKLKPGKTGIICANDATAALLISSLDVSGMRIGRDLLVGGFDDMKYAEHLKYPLTSYRQPCEEIANVAVELMMRRISNADLVPVTVSLTGELVVRESTRFV